MSEMPTGIPHSSLLEKLRSLAETVPNYFGRFLDSVFRLVLGGTAVERTLAKMQPTIDAINALEPELMELSDEQLASKTGEFRNRYADGETLDDLLVEAFAVVREAARRVEGHPYPKRHYDVQLLGGIVLHRGMIAEMITGEGKTLVATLPAYLNALTGKSVHVVTVNDYLARRDAAWMSPVYEFLGLSVGAIQSDMDPRERGPVYACDIVYGTNNEFGFDYLRDNMKLRAEDQAQRELHYAIIDEVDSVLIDEARTPLIISGAGEGATDKYYVANRAAQRLRKGDHYEVKEKERSVVLTEEGILTAQKLCGVTDFYTGKNIEWPHFMDNALKAKELYQRDKEYVVREGQVIIVDQFTGRLMPGRRWSDGLHQAVEAKENLQVQEENQTLATITFQNFFRLYNKLSGMTGTAMTEAGEFNKIYDLEVIPIPPNRPLRRQNHPDIIYATDKEKVEAIIEEIARIHQLGRPVLVGTISVERSEMLSERLKRRGIKHDVLNAKYHKKESLVVAQAGEPGAVTIATNMAGRGTDIVLGGNPTLALQGELEVRHHRTETESRDLINVFRYAKRFTESPPDEPAQIVLPGLPPGERAVWDPNLQPGENIHRIAGQLGIDLEPELGAKLLARLSELEDQAEADHKNIVELGGLHIVGTERHESRRIDNQLRGRAGRQGDPGSSRFFLSLEDDLMRIFMGDWVRGFMQKTGLSDGQEIESGMVSRAIERAQKKVEEQNFNYRKQVLEYDEVMNEQRKLVYSERQAVLEAFRERPADEIAREVINDFIDPEWLRGEEIELERSFQPAASAVRAAAGVAVEPDVWRAGTLRIFSENAAEQAAANGRPKPEEIEARAKQAVTEVVGPLKNARRGTREEQRTGFKRLGFDSRVDWDDLFAQLLIAKLSEAVEPAETKDLVRDWARRGLHADLPVLRADSWDYDTFKEWIGDLPCRVDGAEWPGLLGRPEKIEPLVAERLTEGLGEMPAGQVIDTLVTRTVRLYVDSEFFRRRPSAMRLSLWVECRFGVRISPTEFEEIADEAANQVADELAASKAEQLDEPEGVALYWHYPAIFNAVTETLKPNGRDFDGLARRLRDDFGIRIDGFELSKLPGEDMIEKVAHAIDESKAPNIYCSGLDEIIARMLHEVIDSSVGLYLTAEDAPEERNFEPLVNWAERLGLHITKEQWLALTRQELPVLFGSQVLELPEEDALGFARRCVRSSVEEFLTSEAFAEDPSYEHLAAWSRGRFSFASSPIKLDSALSKKVDSKRSEAKETLIEHLTKEVEAEGWDQPEVIDRLIADAMAAYFATSVGTEEIALEPLARWVNSKLHISVPAAQMQETMDIDERTLTHLVCERAQKSLARKQPSRIVTDVIAAAIDCFLPPQTLPDTWYAEAFQDWLKHSDLDGYLDVYELLESVNADILDVFVEAAMAGYKERSPQAVAVDAARHVGGIFLHSDLNDEGRNFAGLGDKINRKFGLGVDPFELSKLPATQVRDLIEERAFVALEKRTREMGRRQLHWAARVLILQAIDSRWKDHLELMDHLKSGIGMRGYAQIDPKIAYKKEGYEAFEAMVDSIHEEVSDMLLKVRVELGTEVEEEEEDLNLVHSSVSAYEQAEAEKQAAGAGGKSRGVRRPVRAADEPGRNDPCPCGSGKKYKSCCMKKG